MNPVLQNVDLLPYNTFRVSALAKSYSAITGTDDIKNLPEKPIFVLGEGANTLFTKDLDGLVIKNEIRGVRKVNEDTESVVLEVGAGENWHEFVMYTAENGWSGIENLAYIPGTVGAAPVQNLAAYGQNFGEVVASVTGVNLNTGKLQTLSNKECLLFYRDSIFKHSLKDKFIITSVTVNLSKTPKYETNYHGSKTYESLQAELNKIAPGVTNYTSKQIAQATINIRTIKLPDWRKIGTAGSFFKNPFVTTAKFSELSKTIQNLQAYPINAMLYPNPDDPVFKMSDMVKIPAGKLLEELGWRGKRIGNVATHEKHALVIVNLGDATGQEILSFAKLMQDDVKKSYGIDLESEVNVV